mgnify:FL=1
MKNANGMGSVYKQPGKRRKPWVVRKTVRWEIDEKTGRSKQIYKNIGYYATKQDALAALINYNQNPYDVDSHKLTFSDVYEKWSNEHFEKIAPSATRTYKSAYNHSKSLHDIRMRDIRPNHLEDAIKNADVGNSTKSRMKSLYNQLFKYALKYDIVDKDYAALSESVKREDATIIRIPFSHDEIQTLWENVNFPFADMVLIGIYSGLRPQELATLKIINVDLKNRTFFGGLKSEAGRNRYVPIHSAIFELVVANYNKALAMGSSYLFNDENGQQGTHMTYDKYRGRFKKINKRFNMSHKPHDTRHTFITCAKSVNMNEFILKLIVGHQIDDVTEKVYTHRTIQELAKEIEKINY